jgi:hypothetical protein
MFLKFFDIYWNRPGIWLHKFAAGVTKLLTPDEIRRFDGTEPVLVPWQISLFCEKSDISDFGSFCLCLYCTPYIVLKWILHTFLVNPPFNFYFSLWEKNERKIPVKTYFSTRFFGHIIFADCKDYVISLEDIV